jgi:predicted nucleic acid-binding protein
LSGPSGPATADTNIVFYALTLSSKTEAATTALRASQFLSVQVLNEYANASVRKRNLSWERAQEDIGELTRAIPHILPISAADNAAALRIAERYRLSFYDSLILAVALSGGATTIYSEDMQHDLVIDDSLRIVDPFR